MRILLTLLGCLVVASLATSIRAQTTAWKTPQPSGTSRPFPFPLVDGNKLLLGAIWIGIETSPSTSPDAPPSHSISTPSSCPSPSMTPPSSSSTRPSRPPFPQGGIITIILEQPGARRDPLLT
ncbi:hypothetical protein M427DRAFT_268086 [Gonapodya prolifera JEL478]|uniref:Uncharacterized protein n=1 Tax=Gonapodya prolifera (strain JEL478) TaxID=1344416 RepID=A0A139AJR1_GONPJ|nr:hypothetical protein M427DRAFT_268086 [Gonapodya prolifera JEL478]|eukprot:KXS16948.1 hypothetical protein M427DRAFT_268086 [Gonapodya prolifera JEL478]